MGARRAIQKPTELSYPCLLLQQHRKASFKAEKHVFFIIFITHLRIQLDHSLIIFKFIPLLRIAEVSELTRENF